MVSAQVKQHVKVIERKLDSVRKERESVILRIENEVKHAFSRQNSRDDNRKQHQHMPQVPVGIKQYGSQASSLAVDSSDVDLAVTGLKMNGDHEK